MSARVPFGQLSKTKYRVSVPFALKFVAYLEGCLQPDDIRVIKFAENVFFSYHVFDFIVLDNVLLIKSLYCYEPAFDHVVSKPNFTKRSFTCVKN